MPGKSIRTQPAYTRNCIIKKRRIGAAFTFSCQLWVKSGHVQRKKS